MFTGLIAEVGKVRKLERRGREGRLSLACAAVTSGAKLGDSIAVDGACVTVEALDDHGFSAFLSAETLEKTTLGALRAGDGVNLEASLRPADRMGGHMVQGHVEGVGTVAALERLGEGWTLAVDLPPALAEFVVPKGSIALDGVSLTAAALEGDRVTVAVIPATVTGTTLGSWKPGSRVNVETDMVGRYIVAYLKRLRPGRGLSIDELIDKGY